MDSMTAKLDAITIDKLKDYARLLAEASSAVRLTGPRDADVIYRDLILDCLYSAPFFDGCRSVIDVGTGGGIPGIVLAIVMPQTRFVLVDSIAKKTKIVERIAHELGCSNVQVVNARSEEYAVSARESFDAAVARAVASAPILAEYLSPFVRVGGRAVASKGGGAEGELDVPRGSWARLGLSDPQLNKYVRDGRDFFAVVWEKTAACPAAFPRRPGEAAKRPWAELPDQRRL